MASLPGRGCAKPTLGSAGPHKHKQAKVGTLGSPKSKQDTDLALQRGCATCQAGDVEVEGSLPLDLPQQSAEGVLGEAEPWWAASGQPQAGSEWQSLRGGHHARPGILREELQGTEQGHWWGSEDCTGHPACLWTSWRGSHEVCQHLNDDRAAPGCSGTGKGCICYILPTETLPIS